ncbi:MAG: hypothetical protein EOM24_19470, partial [Chloroflexia bacterium]|nr:hypothetical protein [Chloroflexia bacterium]
MIIKDLCAAYEKVQQKHHLPKLEPAALRVETTRDLTPQAAWDALKRLQPLDGWLQFQSYTASFMCGALPEPQADWG